MVDNKDNNIAYNRCGSLGFFEGPYLCPGTIIPNKERTKWKCSGCGKITVVEEKSDESTRQ